MIRYDFSLTCQVGYSILNRKHGTFFIFIDVQDLFYVDQITNYDMLPHHLRNLLHLIIRQYSTAVLKGGYSHAWHIFG